MAPLPKSLTLVTALAIAVKDILQDTNTPKILRDKLARFAAELRDSLSPDKARTVDGMEAEAVILACAETSPLSSPDESSHLSRPETLLEHGSISADSAR